MLELDRILANPEAYHRAWVAVTMESGIEYEGYIFPKGGPEMFRKVTFVSYISPKKAEETKTEPGLFICSLLLIDKIRLIQLGV